MAWIYSTLCLLCVSVCDFWAPVSSAVVAYNVTYEPILNGVVEVSTFGDITYVEYFCNEPFYSLPGGLKKVKYTSTSDGKWKDDLGNLATVVAPQCIPVCGRPAVSVEKPQRILGGDVAPDGTFPWQVEIVISNRSTGAGMVIGDRWVMTSATVLSGQRKESFKLYVGHNNREILFQSSPLEAASLHPHPDLSNTYDNDIGLIKLKHPITYNNSVMPVCLPATDAKYVAGQIGMVSGFGTISQHGPTSRDLRFVQIPVVDQTKCWGTLSQNMLCAGLPEGGKDSCTGDSGAAYVLRDGDSFWVAGISSWGSGCGLPGRYGVYTRVGNYLDWINKTMVEN